MKRSRSENYCYIPEFILKNFCSQKGLFETGVYQIDKRDKSENFINPQSIKYGNYLFKLEATKIISKEELFFVNKCFEQNEEHFDEVIKKLNKRQQLSEEDRDYLYLLFVLLLMRSPEFGKLEWKDLAKKKVRLPEIPYQRYVRICKIICNRNRLNPETIFNALLSRIVKLILYSYSSDSNLMINGYSPVLLSGYYYLPISKNICLCLTPKNLGDFNQKEDISLFVGSEMIKNNGPYVYGSKSLDLKVLNNEDKTKIHLKRL